MIRYAATLIVRGCPRPQVSCGTYTVALLKTIHLETM